MSRVNTAHDIEVGADGSVQTRFNADDSPAEEAVYAVAALKGVEPTDLNPLYNLIDPDAVDALFEGPLDGGENPVVLMFTMAECRVTLRSDRTLSVYHTDETS